MAGTSLLTLLDDIATILDDVSTMTGVAARKTAGVLGDDLALNAEQVSGVRADRELPVVWAVFKGSAKNKCILVPAALLISAFVPWLITPLLMIGGAFLCYEGFEKVAHVWLESREAQHERHVQPDDASDQAVYTNGHQHGDSNQCADLRDDVGFLNCAEGDNDDLRGQNEIGAYCCLLYTSPSPRDS